ncbi:S41 family peptidase [Deinococcus radiophilus]|uniref:PDZ domain-containing protein n=1 Tax=Deinococcus radiophilus TaxID=32062 RepID=A0A3S0KAD0_9DEIO|nr:S41 family peptidase [Deinococcus radiophilus]RTR26258.1 PDZ domain-containing protein [Deinococcus radiophilus]UFA50328.1 PDZ domain-containing protein [Deinococcus radiophilus]
MGQRPVWKAAGVRWTAGWLVLVLWSAGLAQTAVQPRAIPALPPQQQVQPAPEVSAAQQAFSEVAAQLLGEYGGLSAVDRQALIREYQGRLDAVCQAQGPRCAADTAYPVIEAQLTALGDPHTFLQWPDEYQEFLSSALGGDRVQYGVKLADLDGERRLVTEVIPGSAAAQAGLRRGDVLLTLNGVAYTYRALTDAREASQAVRLGVDRQGQRLSVSLQAARTSAAELPRLSWVGERGRTALIRIPTFLAGGRVAVAVHRQVAWAQARGADGVVVDLRGNAGGSLLECDLAASAFVPRFERVSQSADGPQQMVVQGGQRRDDAQLIGAVPAPQLWRGPLAVLVDQSSASCAEFFAYEVQRAGVGQVVGEATAGVGNTATRVYAVTGGAGLQMTVLHYAKPGGVAYPVRVQPDLTVQSGEAFLRALAQGRDLTLEAGLQALRSQPRHGLASTDAAVGE